MSNIVNLSPFPKKRYDFIETLPNNEYCTITKYKNKAQKIDYLIYTYTIRSLSDRIKEKIKGEIEYLSKFEEKEDCKIAVVNKAYIDMSE